MSELRQEFEINPEISKYIENDDIYFNNKNARYESIIPEHSYNASWVNGAWWAYQEQHKKIVAYQKMIEIQKGFDEANAVFRSTERIANSALHHGEYLIGKSALGKPQQNITIALDGDKIEEIFMVNSNELRNNR